MADLWQNAMDHAVAAARRAGQVRVCVCDRAQSLTVFEGAELCF